MAGRGNNVDTPYDDRGEGITPTQKLFQKKIGLNMSRGVFSSQHKQKTHFCRYLWEDFENKVFSKSITLRDL